VTSSSTDRASISGAGTQADRYSLWPSLSGDGRHVAFWTSTTNLVTPDTNGTTSDVIVRANPVPTRPPAGAR